MAVLLSTLGLRPMVLVEAFGARAGGFREVHVFCGEAGRAGAEEVTPFFRDRAESYSVNVLHGFDHLRNAGDHECFEEGLWRWYLARVRSAVRVDGLPWVCLSGGYKSMSASMQKAATLFGASEVFHVLCEGDPDTVEAVEEAGLAGCLQVVRMGAEPGWQLLRDLDPGDYALEVVPPGPEGGGGAKPGGDGTAVTVAATAGGGSLRERANRLVSRVGETLSPIEANRESPDTFPAITVAPDAVRAWLAAALDPAVDDGWVRQLPKVELHCHLGGFATHGDILAQVRSAAEEPEEPWPPAPGPPPAWPRPTSPVALDTYMSLGDANGSRLLRDPRCLRTQVDLLYRQMVEDGVVYAEVRCSPNNYSVPGRSAWEVLEDIRSRFEEAMSDAAAGSPGGRPPCWVNLIVIVTRKQSGDLTDIARHLALAVTAAQVKRPGGCNVVGVDLAGFENPETRPLYFAQDFEVAHRCGLAVTAHAGENDDAESIWQAVYKLSARRLGHALHLGSSRDLFRAVRDRGIGVEMCPFANFQIAGFHPMPGHEGRRYPLRSYLKEGIRVTANTDNIGISAAGLSDNLLFLAELCPGITRAELVHLQRNAVEVAFLDPLERNQLMAEVDARLRRLLK